MKKLTAFICGVAALAFCLPAFVSCGEAASSSGSDSSLEYNYSVEDVIMENTMFDIEALQSSEPVVKKTGFIK